MEKCYRERGEGRGEVREDDEEKTRTKLVSWRRMESHERKEERGRGEANIPRVWPARPNFSWQEGKLQVEVGSRRQTVRSVDECGPTVAAVLMEEVLTLGRGIQ